MATRTIPLAVYATDGTLYTTTATPPTITVQYGSGAASATTVTQRGDGWSVAIDDTQDALLLISGTGITADHLVVLRFPTQLDANVSSRSTYAGADTAGTTTLLSRITGTRAGFLDQLEHVADHLDSLIAFGAPPSAATIAAAVRDLATSGLAALKALIDGVKAKTDNLPASPAAVGSNMGSVASVTAPVTVGTNNDKTGYSGTATNMVAAPPDISDLPTNTELTTALAGLTVTAEVDANAIAAAVAGAIEGNGGTLTLPYSRLLDSNGDGVPDDPNVKILDVRHVLTSDPAGTMQVGSAKVADSQGNVTWYGLVAGTYYVHSEKPGYTFSVDTEVVA